MEKTMQGRARAGWQDKETERLFQAVDQAAREGQPLRHVFESLSGELGRKPNSIRNYYYARLRQHPESTVQRAAPFQTFTQEEVRALLRQVLMARGQGKSVRSCTDFLHHPAVLSELFCILSLGRFIRGGIGALTRAPPAW